MKCNNVNVLLGTRTKQFVFHFKRKTQAPAQLYCVESKIKRKIGLGAF